MKILFVSFLAVFFVGISFAAERLSPEGPEVIPSHIEKMCAQAQDIVIVAVYKYVYRDQQVVSYARVTENMKGDIPVESLVYWVSNAAGQKDHIAYVDAYPLIICLGAKQKEMIAPPYAASLVCKKPYKKADEERALKLPDGFENAAFYAGIYRLSPTPIAFPKTESDVGKAIQEFYEKKRHASCVK